MQSRIFIQRVPISQVADVLRRRMVAELVGHIVTPVAKGDSPTWARQRAVAPGSMERSEVMYDDVPRLRCETDKVKIGFVPVDFRYLLAFILDTGGIANEVIDFEDLSRFMRPS